MIYALGWLCKYFLLFTFRDTAAWMLIDMRKQARDNKNFALSDQIRDQLIALGIQLKDGKEGTTFSI